MINRLSFQAYSQRAKGEVSSGRGIFFALTIFSLALIGCRSTKLNERTQFLADGLEVNAYDDVFKIYDTDFEKDLKEGDKFIFLRLYYPNYDNKISGVNFLKFLINSVDPNPEQASHSSIGFSLQDEFYGLTLYKPQCLKPESCINISTNKYMKMCNKYTSIQTLLAIKVTTEEYQKAKELLEHDYALGKTKYLTLKNIPIGTLNIKRKHQKTKEKRILGGIPHKKFADPEIPENNFVCSSYIAYILVKSIKSVNDFFREKKLDYALITPTDLFYIPGVKKLFTSSWADYDIAAEEFVKSELIFSDYLY